jgi:hypothetical protein
VYALGSSLVSQIYKSPEIPTYISLPFNYLDCLSLSLSLSANAKPVVPLLLGFGSVLMATTSYSGIGRYNYKFLPLSLSSMRACPCRSSPSKPLIPARPGSKVGFVFDGRQSVLRLARNGGLTLSRVITAVARAEPDRLGEDNAKQVVPNLVSHMHCIYWKYKKKLNSKLKYFRF